MIIWFFGLYSIDMPYYMNWFLDIKPTLHSWSKSHLVIAYNTIFFICSWIQSPVFEALYIHKRYWSVVFFFLWYLSLMGVLLSQPKLRNDFGESVSGQRKNFESLLSWWEFYMQGFEFLAEYNLQTRWKDHKVSVDELLFLPMSFAKCVTLSKLPRIFSFPNSE